MIQSSRQRKEKGERNLQRFSKINISNFKRRIQVSKSKIYIYIYNIFKKKNKKEERKERDSTQTKRKKNFHKDKIDCLGEAKRKGKFHIPKQLS